MLLVRSLGGRRFVPLALRRRRRRRLVCCRGRGVGGLARIGCGHSVAEVAIAVLVRETGQMVVGHHLLEVVFALARGGAEQ
jgi:hypothetical protein